MSKQGDADKKLKSLKKMVCKQRKHPIFKSNNRNNVDELESGNFILRINNNALEIYAKDVTGTRSLRGFVPLYNINTQPVMNLYRSNNYIQRYTVAPYKVIYIDSIETWWPQSAIADIFRGIVDAGFNIINLAFMVNGVACDMALVWNRELADINPVTGKKYRDEVLEYAHNKGCSILLSTGGSTENNFIQTDPALYSKTVTDFVLSTSLDGVDFDLENFGPGLIAYGSSSSQDTINWLVNVTNITRNTLGPYALISHSPQSPYFSSIGSNNSWAGPLGGYTGVYNGASSIDFFNVQYYNQGVTNYVTYNGIFVDAAPDFPQSAVTQLTSWIPLNKFVVGKPMRQTDASTGYNTPEEINSIILQAKTLLGWNAGIMTWQYPYDTSNPIEFCKEWLDIVTKGL